IDCKDCNASYVCQMSVDDFKLELKNIINTSLEIVELLITDHRLQLHHEFKWDEVAILDKELVFHKRLISEMCFIKKQNNSLNLQTEIEYLHHNY
ncbi:hypothetical protein EAG_06940, partial [Camponotus floridanus]